MVDKLDDLLVELIESHTDRVRVLELVGAEIQRALEEPTQNERDLWAENERLRALVQEHITVHHCLVCGSS